MKARNELPRHANSPIRMFSVLFYLSFVLRVDSSKEEHDEPLIHLGPVPEAKYVRFANLGKVTWGKRYATLISEVSVNELCSAFNQILNFLDEAKEHALESNYANSTASRRSYVNAMFEKWEVDFIAEAMHLELLSNLAKADCVLLLSWKDRHDERERKKEANRRGKRQAALWLLAGTVGMTVLQEIELANLRARVKREEETMEEVASLVERENTFLEKTAQAIKGLENSTNIIWMKVRYLEKSYDFLPRLVEFGRELSKASRHLLHITKACIFSIQQLLIHPLLLPTNSFQDEVELLAKKAKKKELYLVSENLADIVREPCSFLSEHGNLTFFLHLPVRGKLYDLYSLQRQVFAVKPNLTLYLKPKAENVLAIDSNKELSTSLTPVELAACTVRRTEKLPLYMCPPRVMKKTEDGRGGCLASLFLDRKQLILEQCEFLAIGTDETLFSADSDEVRVHSAYPVQVDLKCPNQTESYTVVGSHIMHVGSGCEISTPHFSFRNDGNANLSVTHTKRLMNLQVQDLLPDETAFIELLKLADLEDPSPKDVSKIKEMIRKGRTQRQHNWTTAIFRTGYLIGLIVLAVVIIVFTGASIFAMWTRWKRRRSLRLQVEEDSMPPLEIHPID